MIKISVITVVYQAVRSGRTKDLIRNIKSVHAQKNVSCEHIYVDGNSDDGTCEILKKYQKMGWIKYISEKDNGIYDAMNKGILLSKGEYVTFLNTDDYYHDKNGLSLSIKYLEASRADFSYSPVRMTVCVKNKVRYLKKNEHPHISPDIQNVYSFMPFCHQGMIIKTSVMKSYMYDTTFKSAGDYDLLLRLCISEKNGVYVPINYVTFSCDGTSNKNQNISIIEVSKAYYKNYSQLCKINMNQCEQIYCRSIDKIPHALANALRNNKYFNYAKYHYAVHKNKNVIKKLRNYYNENEYILPLWIQKTVKQLVTFLKSF